MIVCDIALFICIFMLGVELLGHRKRLDLINDDLEEFDADIGNLKQRCEGHKELIEALSKSVRELNGVVEAAVKVKEETSDNKPDIKALMGGWTTDEGQTNVDGKSLMNCGLPNLSDSAREKIFELLGVKVPEKEKPADTYYLGVGVDDDKMLKIPVRDTGQTLVDGEPIRHGRLWTNSEGRIYELPEGCYILGDTPYEMD